ncbi:probable ubiquitin-conjugating enzyme E2 21 [Frankliniella occidentalis]|uniref:Probable ubiquitin-conjugating enzyme E2 21 n=1 Tax=Frankliniella occidentalis TaxID=133901 RepID=A0A9C6X4W4_FRAOC|nr:probable ubiquitin-conjugating enzyme E2 21 [Frankliniella occidentalis]
MALSFRFRENDCGISVVVGDDLLGFDAFIKGPAGTPYEGGTFKVRINIPAEYPMQPPVATFKTEIWHPNISSMSGYVCLDTLGSKWVGCMNFRAVLLSLQNLLMNPEPADPQDAVVGGQAQRDLRDTAEMWTHIFAGGCFVFLFIIHCLILLNLVTFI